MKEILMEMQEKWQKGERNGILAVKTTHEEMQFRFSSEALLRIKENSIEVEDEQFDCKIDFSGTEVLKEEEIDGTLFSFSKENTIYTFMLG